MQIKSLLNQILFLPQIERIKNQDLKKYLKDFFCIKVISIKIITLLLATLICGLCFFLIRANVLNGNINVKPAFNLGAAFSSGSNMNQSGVYAIKILISIFFLLIWLFNNKWYLNIPAFFISINGWFNVIDKTMVDYYLNEVHYNAVVDYIYLNAGSLSSIANVADVFITIAICCFVLGLIGYIYVMFKEEKNQKDSDVNDPSNSLSQQKVDKIQNEKLN